MNDRLFANEYFRSISALTLLAAYRSGAALAMLTPITITPQALGLIVPVTAFLLSRMIANYRAYG